MLGGLPACFALSGLSYCRLVYPGRRCALPWADMLRPLRDKILSQNLCINDRLQTCPTVFMQPEGSRRQASDGGRLTHLERYIADQL